MLDDRSLMLEALAEAARAADVGEVPIGAVISHGGRIIARAHNQRETDQDPTAHAEMIALRKAAKVIGSWRLEGCTLAVTLEPCPMCAGAMVNARVQRLIYGAPDPKMGCVDTLHRLCDDARFNHRLEIIAGVEADQSVALLQAFFQARRGDSPPAKPGR